MDDDGLMRRAAAGDTQAFGRLVQTHQQRVVRFAARMLGGDLATAEDAAQEAFLRLWRGRERYRAQGKLDRLLLRIVRNVCLDHARSDRPEAPLEAARETAESCEAGPEPCAQQRALAAAVRQAVLELPEPQRAVFVLSHYEGLSYRDIAEIVACPVGTVASRKHLAVETLRRRLGAWIEPEARG